MSTYLNSQNFPAKDDQENTSITTSLDKILSSDFTGSFFELFGQYQRILADNQKKSLWPEAHSKLETLFKCGTSTPLDGPMIGIPVSIKDSDYFKEAVSLVGEKRSAIASIEWMATAWNSTFAGTGLWMGKTYEPISEEAVRDIFKNDEEIMSAFSEKNTRIDRNILREPPSPK